MWSIDVLLTWQHVISRVIPALNASSIWKAMNLPEAFACADCGMVYPLSEYRVNVIDISVCWENRNEFLVTVVSRARRQRR